MPRSLSMKRSELALLLVLATNACGDRTPRQSDTVAARPIAARPDPAPRDDAADSVIDSLASYHGTYSTELHSGWQFDGIDEFVPRFQRLGPAGTAALVRCLSRSEPTATTGLPDDTSHVELRKICLDLLGPIAVIRAPCDTLAPWTHVFEMGWPPDSEKKWSELRSAWECTLRGTASAK